MENSTMTFAIFKNTWKTSRSKHKIKFGLQLQVNMFISKI